MAETRGSVRVGTSGWHYDHWAGVFYPEGLAEARRLEHYATVFDLVEANSTFYRLPPESTLAGWRDAVPDGFCFAVKASRYLTHMKKLKDPEEPLRRFLDRVETLGDRLGPILFQLPPEWKPNVERLGAFLERLPRRHRYAFELRDERWHEDAVLDTLRRHDAAFCIFDLAGATSDSHVTADMVYLRLHGPSEERYAGSYSDADLDGWAERIAAWRDAGRDVVVAFDNDQAGNAPRDARRLLGRVR